MLSYMLPIDEKPPSVPTKDHLQLSLASETIANGRTTSTPISKDTSISSFASDGTAATASHSSMTTTSSSDRSRHKFVVNGTKHQSLKRVSFGSSKGSMVETLIYESPLHEEPEPSPIAEHPAHIFSEDLETTETEREKVRVSFFQQSKPQEVDLPDEQFIVSDTELMMAAATLNDTNHVAYIRQESTESGWDNPFRPGGDLSREADEIVELIKGGKPITPTSGGPPSPIHLDHTDSTFANNIAHEPITESPKKATVLNSSLNATPKNANGNVKNDKVSMGAVDVQRGTVVPAGDASQVEHVVIKKKPKCECCVIQ
ncbi:hypothetical protein FQA39_LY18393 [Lamprigera yunnana]|nr:hypothetical protein FQA39_LY18393 [Lamprigera yunnana]